MKIVQARNPQSRAKTIVANSWFHVSLDTEDEKIAFFIVEYCKRNSWDLIEWLKIQAKKDEIIVI